jgi:hypothetical protein
MTPVTGEQFLRTQRLALRRAGIESCDRNGEILVSRAVRAGLTEGAAFDALLDSVGRGDAAARSLRRG